MPAASLRGPTFKHGAAPTTVTPPFVGRTGELSQLGDEMARALGGQGRIVVVTGEAGIGKTWLVRAAVTAATRRTPALRARWVHCGDVAGTPAYWPWRQLLGDSPEFLGPSDPDDETEHFERLHTWVRHVGDECRERPLVLVIDDLHQADDSSLLLLDALAQAMDTWSLIVLATVRDVGATRPTPPHLHALDRHKSVRHLPLQGVNEPEIRQLAEALLACTVPESVAATLRGATNGNPYFLSELLHAFTPEDILRLERNATFAAIPSSIEGLLAARFAVLDDDTRGLLEVAAVIGSTFPSAWLTRLSDAPGDATAHARHLDHAFDARLIEPAEDAGHLRFVHGLVTGVLLGRLPASRLADVHGRVGMLLETERDAGATISPGLLAHHFVAAAMRPELAERAVRYSRQAGAEAAAEHAYELAAEHYRRALAVLGTTSTDDDGGAQRLDRAELLLGLGRALAYGGEPEAATLLDEAETAATRALDSDARRRAASILAWTAVVRCEALSPSTAAECRTARAQGDRALAALGENTPELRARLLAALVPLFRFETDREPMRAMAREANDLAAASGKPTLEGRALGAVHWALLDEPSGEHRLQIASRVLTRANSTQDNHLAATARFWRYLDLLELGRTDDAALELDAYERLAEQLGEPRHRYRAAYLRAGLELHRGNLARADALAETAFELGARLSADEASLNYVSTASTICFVRNDMERLADVHRQNSGLQASYPQARHGSTILFLFRQRPTSAQDDLNAALEHGLDAVPHGPDWLSTMHSLAWAALGLKDARLCATLYDHLRPHAERTILYNFGAVAAGTGHRMLANLATQLGRFEEAEAHFRDATLLSERSQGGFDLMFLPVEWAKLHVARGIDPNDPVVVRLLGESLRRARASGALQIVEQVRAVHPRLVDETDARDGRPVPNRFECVGEACRISFGGHTLDIPSNLGMLFIAALLRRPGEEILATDLIAQVTGETGLSVENARVRVTQRVRFTLDRLRDVHRSLAAHLHGAVRTGKYCVYLPGPDDRVVWRFDDVGR